MEVDAQYTLPKWPGKEARSVRNQQGMAATQIPPYRPIVVEIAESH